MLRTLTAWMLVGVLLAPMSFSVRANGLAEATAGELSAFLKTITDGAQLSTEQYAAQLESIRSRDGQRAVVPTLNILAGRIDAESCLYQLRLDLRWTRGTDADETGGRSLIQKAPCASLADEVVAVANYEVAALHRRLQDGGRFAINREREQVIAAARRRGAETARGPYESFPAVTIGSRVNLRASPSLKAPVLAKLAPASVIELVRTDDSDWFLVRGQPGYVHASALESLHPDTTTQ